MVSVITVGPSRGHTKATTDNTEIGLNGHVPIKLYLHKGGWAGFDSWFMVCPISGSNSCPMGRTHVADVFFAHEKYYNWLPMRERK